MTARRLWGARSKSTRQMASIVWSDIISIQRLSRCCVRIAGFYSRLRAGDLVELSHAEGGPWHLVWNHGGNVDPWHEDRRCQDCGVLFESSASLLDSIRRPYMADLRIPSVQHLARNWRTDSAMIARALVKLALSPPRFNYNPLYSAVRDMLVLNIPYDQVVEGIRRIKREKVREIFWAFCHSFAITLRVWCQISIDCRQAVLPCRARLDGPIRAADDLWHRRAALFSVVQLLASESTGERANSRASSRWSMKS